MQNTILNGLDEIELYEDVIKPNNISIMDVNKNEYKILLPIFNIVKKLLNL